MRIIVSYAADSGYMPDKTNGFKLLEPIGLVRIGLAAAVVVTASTTEEEKNDPDPVIAAAVIIVVATSADFKLLRGDKCTASEFLRDVRCKKR